ncbi:MAG: polyphosphate kinase 1 [Burkholderiales bacterium]|jgi:polyphosphate kinase|nr:polyphosphate kinase 1 [Burkholderiales bacterium]
MNAAARRPRRAPGKAGFAPEFYLNRELGLLSFNRRVLAQAENRAHPLLERLRFLCIVSSNLDEFFEVRVAGLQAEIEAGSAPIYPDQMRADQVYRQVAREAHELVARQYQLLNEEVLPGLEQAGIRFLRRSGFTPQQADWVRSYFLREVMPVLTPIGLDPAHPFPRVLNKSLNFAVELEGKDAFGRNSGIAIVQAPRVLPRVIRLPQEVAGAEYDFVFLSSVLHEHVGELFTGMKVLGCYQFRLTRNSDLFVDEEEVKDLRTALRGELPHRHFGDEVRLEVTDNCSQHISNFLLRQFMLDEEDLYRVDGPVNLARVISVPDWVDRPELKFPQFRPGLPKLLEQPGDMFAAIRARDVLLHHPFQSFQPVIVFLQQAARDPAVAAIKMTVYRTGAESELMEVLISAARSGKEVTVVLELMARFDEEANINWAQRLEEVGAHVVYGVVGHKTHAKMLMVVRREGEGLHRYVHLSTGNYHPRTARLYTDFGLFTSNEDIGNDVADIFMQLTGLGRATKLRHLRQSPFTLHKEMIRAIENETAIAKAGRKGQIIAKMNALLESDVVGALYLASQAGVQIDLIVRGVCALRPGVPGLSENIRVRSIIGRFLEHTRVFHFHNDGAEDVFLSSADWMDRNFFGRVEVCFPILDPELKQRVIAEGLLSYLEDNTQAWMMGEDGQYVCRVPGRAKPAIAQEQLLDLLARKPGA